MSIGPPKYFSSGHEKPRLGGVGGFLAERTGYPVLGRLKARIAAG